MTSLNAGLRAWKKAKPKQKVRAAEAIEIGQIAEVHRDVPEHDITAELDGVHDRVDPQDWEQKFQIGSVNLRGGVENR